MYLEKKMMFVFIILLCYNNNEIILYDAQVHYNLAKVQLYGEEGQLCVMLCLFSQQFVQAVCFSNFEWKNVIGTALFSL